MTAEDTGNPRLTRLESILDAHAWIEAGYARRTPDGAWRIRSPVTAQTYRTRDLKKIALLERACRERQLDSAREAGHG